ncbi:hypothetical protein ACFUMH_12250 [Cellulomonas sp. NPDC057328]|uniref:hypothetical protein n=1 Tax=Cellulomonas sp. NPDC057328 TaxID=3346101 RepID=UPI0036337CF8
MEERDEVRAGAAGPDDGEPTTGAAADPAGDASDDGAPGDGAPDGPGTRTRRLLVVAGALAVVAAVALGVALTTRDGGAPAARTADPTATVTTAPAPTPTASATPDDPATAAPGTPAPDAAAPAPDGAPPAAGGPVPVPPLGDVAPATGTGQEPVAAGPLTVAVTGLEAVTTGAEGIGEIASPGVVVTVEVRGPGGTQLDAAAVAAHAGADSVPLRPADTDGRSAPLPAALPGDGVARGAYVFAAPAAGTPLAVTVLLRLDAPAVVVQGLVAP